MLQLLETPWKVFILTRYKKIYNLIKIAIRGKGFYNKVSSVSFARKMYEYIF